MVPLTKLLTAFGTGCMILILLSTPVLAGGPPLDIYGYNIVADSPSKVYMEVDYYYSGYLGGDVYITAHICDYQGINTYFIGNVPDNVYPGRHRALIAVSVVANRLPSGVSTTTHVKLLMYTRNGTVLERRYPYMKTWRRQSPNISVVAHFSKRVRPGQRASIWLKVLSVLHNQPIAYAQVAVAAGGGRFDSGSGTSIIGQTNVNGEFTAYWSCAPCARGYSFSVQAALPGRPYEAMTVGFVRIE